MNAYEERKQARIDRYHELSAKNRTRAQGRFKASDDAVAGIPAGQPILVGHHSERRHRRALERSDTNMRPRSTSTRGRPAIFIECSPHWIP